MNFWDCQAGRMSMNFLALPGRRINVVRRNTQSGAGYFTAYPARRNTTC
jgi:hypothetical protein